MESTSARGRSPHELGAERYAHPSTHFPVCLSDKSQITTVATGTVPVVSGLNLGRAIAIVLTETLVSGLADAYQSIRGTKLGVARRSRARSA